MFKLKLLFFIIVTIPLSSLAKKSELRFYIQECALETDISCNDIRNNLGSYFGIGRQGESDFSLIVKSDLENRDPQVNAYIIKIYNDDSFKEINFSLKTSLSYELALQEVINHILGGIKLMFPELNIKGQGNWLFEPSTSAQFAKGQLSQDLVLGGGLDLSYYHKKRDRINTYMNISYANGKSPKTATTIASQVIDERRNIGIWWIHTLKKNKHLSWFLEVGRREGRFRHSETDLLPDIGKENIAWKNHGTFGLEWVKEPFLKEVKSNYGVQIFFSPEDHRYVDPEKYEYIRERYLNGYVSFSVEQYRPNNNVIRASVTSYIDLNKFKHSGVSLNITPEFTLGKRVNLAPTLNLYYQNNQILSPVINGNSGGNFLAQTGAKRGKFFSMNTNVRLTLTLGNTAKKEMDRRWR